MKKFLLSVFLLSTTALVFGQNSAKNEILPAPETTALTNNGSSKNSINVNKTLACVDTLRYPQVKEQILGTPTFYTFELWTDDAEYMSQAFLLSGTSISISGVEVFARRKPTSTSNLVLRASIYNVDGSNNPTTEIGFATITITDTSYSYRQINFTPVSVSGNYAVVIRPTSAGGIVEFYVNNAATGQSYDEGLSRIRSSYYTTSNGAWVSVPVLTSGFTGGPFDFEMLVAPKVSYTINTDFTVTPNSTCLGNPISFTNTTTPTGVLNSRFYNYNIFLTYFQSIPDSTYVYDMDGVSPLVWTANTSYTYSTAGTYNPILYTLGGFWASCLDNNTKTVTINPNNTASAASSTPTVCVNTLMPNITHTTTGATGIGAAIGLPPGVTVNWVSNTITTSGTPTVTGTFNYTIPLTGGCGTINATGTIIVMPNNTASSPSSTPTVCTNTALTNITHTTTGATGISNSGVSGANGLPTGVSATWTGNIITISGTPSVDGTFNYSIPLTSGCGTVNATGTIIVTPNVTPTFTAVSAICSGDALAALPTTSNNGITGTWSPALNNTATTTYTFTPTAGQCATTTTLTITVNSATTPTFTPVSAICSGDALAALPTTSNNGITGTWSPAIDNTTTTTYTFTPTAGQCATTTTLAITVNSATTPTFTPVSAICSGDALAALPTTSNNGITGTWSPAIDNTTTTTYTFTPTVGQCATTTTLMITVNTVDTTTTTNNLTITANNTSATYQWVDCNNGNQPITNETNQSFTATVNGNYAVIVTENGCNQMSACVNITTVGIEKSISENKLIVYPNPITENLTLISSTDFNGALVKVMTLTGQILVETKVILGTKHLINMREFSSGLYFVEVNQNGKLTRIKVVKN